MNNKRRILAGLFCFALAVSCLVGCMKNPDNANLSGTGTSGDSGGKSDAAKDTLVVALQSDISTFDPCKFTDLVTQNAVNALYNKLFKFSTTSEVVPDLAESYKNISELEWEITLRKDVKFHDGTAMTSADVKASLERTMADTSKSHLVGSIAKVDAPDANTVLITMKTPTGTLLESLADPCCSILPAALISSGHDFGSEPVGTGPYKLVSWEPANKVVFESFQDYFIAEEVAYYPNLEMRVIPEGSSRTIALETGDVDIIVDLARSDYNRIHENPNLALYETAACQLYYLGFNMDDPVCQDENFRKAWQYAVDKEGARLVSLEGLGAIVENVIPANVMGYHADENYTYDPEKAKELLADANFTQDKPLVLCCYSEDTSKIAQVIQANMKEVGVEVEIAQNTTAVHIDGTAKGDFAFFLSGWSTAPNPDRFLRPLYHSSAVGATNAVRLNDPAVDALIDAAATEVDAAKRESLYSQALDAIMERSPSVPICSKPTLVAYNAALENVTINSVSETYYNIIK